LRSLEVPAPLQEVTGKGRQGAYAIEERKYDLDWFGERFTKGRSTPECALKGRENHWGDGYAKPNTSDKRQLKAERN